MKISRLVSVLLVGVLFGGGGGCGDDSMPMDLDAGPTFDAVPRPDGDQLPDAEIMPDVPGRELVCSDGLDDDGDGDLDCFDQDCDGLSGCEFPGERTCYDGRDNDLDTAIDCADSDCDAVMRCEHGAERSCVDGYDNDADGLVDCADADCAPASICLVGCPRGSSVATYLGTVPVPIIDLMSVAIPMEVPADGLVTGIAVRLSVTHTWDHDLDLLLTSPSGTTIDLSSANGAGGDNYTDTLFVDSAALSISDGVAPFTGPHRPEEPLSGYSGELTLGPWTVSVFDRAERDNGEVTFVQLYLCYCTGCEVGSTCEGGVDDDGDGAIDCDDSDCAGWVTCVPELDCANGLDDDGDGVADCLDAECDGVAGCEFGMELDCEDDVDNDGDLVADCADSDCEGISGCEFGVESTCDDGLDNDGDGATDCDDGACAFGCFFRCPAGSHGVDVSGAVPAPIPDEASNLVSLLVSSPGAVVGAVVVFSTTHDFVADLDIELLSPSGTSIDLSSDNGGSGANYTGTYFADSATRSITGGTAPFSGAYQPEAPLGTLIGEPAGGDWALRVTDDAAGDSGEITFAQLHLCVCDSCELGALCTDGVDNDGNGAVDCADAGCAAHATCFESNCSDGLDSDADGATDCADLDCDLSPTCSLVCPPGATLATVEAMGLPAAVMDMMTTTLPVTISAVGMVTGAAVRFSAEHTFDYDLSIRLVSPMGTTIDLSTGNGADGNHYTNTFFTDAASTAITAGSPPFAGPFRPEHPLANLNGEAAMGSWQLTVRDGFAGEAGRVTAFRLFVCVM
ncbi:MAG: hypothetical protein EXR73_07595 [Myxococcales bacterium]|nr:hypothetical protein [Myxococcales bacterium]